MAINVSQNSQTWVGSNPGRVFKTPDTWLKHESR